MTITVGQVRSIADLVWPTTSTSATTTGNFTITLTSSTATGLGNYGMYPLMQMSASTTTIQYQEVFFEREPETDEQRQVRQAAAEAWRQEREERARLNLIQSEERLRIREAAEERATALLNSLLTSLQQESWRTREWFDVVGSRGGTYRIHKGLAGNVVARLEDNRIAEYCCHLKREMPIADNVLAQMLLITHCEEAFLDLANGSKPQWFLDEIRGLAPHERPALRLVS